jgi:hypothetical protein
MIKVCINPNCEEVAHFIDKSETHCRNCGSRMLAINDKTYEEKYKSNFFQYDYRTGEIYRQK